MNNTIKRILLFLIFCIGTRVTLVYLAKTLNPTHLRWMGYMLLLPAIGFTLIFVTGSRKTGAETFGAPIWWNSLRPIHALLYFTAGYYAITGDNNKAATALLIDVMIGLTGFIVYHFLSM